jgi:hypothetical protein
MEDLRDEESTIRYSVVTCWNGLFVGQCGDGATPAH